MLKLVRANVKNTVFLGGFFVSNSLELFARVTNRYKRFQP